MIKIEIIYNNVKLNKFEEHGNVSLNFGLRLRNYSTLKVLYEYYALIDQL